MMSDIPKSKRAKSPLEALHAAYHLRWRVTAELMASFAYSEKKLEAHIRKRTSYIKNDDERTAAIKAIREAEENFAGWFIKRERDRVADFCQGITEHLRAANTIYPQYRIEFDERRLEMDKALECCNKLQDELQYIAETMPADKNKYMGAVLECESVFRQIKALRQSDNRFLKTIKG